MIKNTEHQLEFRQFCRITGSDKSSMNHTFAGYNYMDHYADLLGDWYMNRETTELNILEIGIFKGASLEMWRLLFPKATIIGLDVVIPPDVFMAANDVGSFTVYKGRQEDEEILAQLHDKHGPFDLIIDDGSHRFDDMLATATYMIPRMRPGGLYVIEDLHVGWPMPSWPGMEKTWMPPNNWDHIQRFLNQMMINMRMRTGPVLSLHYYHGMVAFRIADTKWQPPMAEDVV